MAKKKKKKTIKIEIPVPEMPSASEITKSMDPEKVHKTIKEKIPKEEIEKTAKFIEKYIPKEEIEKARMFAEKNIKPLAVVVVAIIAVIVVAFSQSSQPQQGTVTGPVYQTITVEVPVEITFDEYLQNYQSYAGQEVTVVGFLLNRLEQGGGAGTLGIYAYYMVDDLNGEIHLTGLDAIEKALFTKGNLTKGLYEVSGVIKTKYGGFDLEVTSITPTERPTRPVERTVQVGS
ncbi:MAG: hypothetical protein JSV63_03485 [Candidatus Aenigmatarchaeota archaeon]|nr:MAG: hypothetical protein JSV63_03485 [Candidatus Aenigmarchaeota archaeon]